MRSDAVLAVIELKSTICELPAERGSGPAPSGHPRIGFGCKTRTGGNEPGSCGLHHLRHSLQSDPDPTRRDILEQARQILTPDGALLVYQFTDAVLPYLKSSFGSFGRISVLEYTPGSDFSLHTLAGRGKTPKVGCFERARLLAEP